MVNISPSKLNRKDLGKYLLRKKIHNKRYIEIFLILFLLLFFLLFVTFLYCNYQYILDIIKLINPSFVFGLTNSINLINSNFGVFASAIIGILGVYYTWNTFKLNREKHISDRYAKAIEQLSVVNQLGNPVMETRIGAIYTLHTIAFESARDYPQIMLLLTDYVRLNSSNNKNKRDKPISPDIETILKVVKLRQRKFDDFSNVNFLDFSDAYLREACFKSAKFEKAIFEKADLQEALFQCAYLRNANLKGANLQGADFEGANLQGANFEGADLKEANFEGARNLIVDQLSKAKTLYKAQLGEGLEEELREKGFGYLLDNELEK